MRANLPMGMLGYQSNANRVCTPVSQLSYNPSAGPLYYSPDQCASLSGSTLQSGAYQPPSAFHAAVPHQM